MESFVKNARIHLENDGLLVILNRSGVFVFEIHAYVPSIDRWVDVSNNSKAQDMAEEMLSEYLAHMSDKDDTDFSYKDDENYKGAI